MDGRLSLPRLARSLRPPPPAAQKAAPAPVIDHTPAIREAMRRRQCVAIEVVGVEVDKALLPPTAPHACHWPLGDLKDGTLRSCGAPAVDGRMYCPDHCKKAGQKSTPRVAATVGRVAAPFGAHELEAEG